MMMRIERMNGEDGEDDEEEHEEEDDDNGDDLNSPCIRDATDAVITISQEFDSQAMVLVCQLVKPDDDDWS